MQARGAICRSDIRYHDVYRDQRVLGSWRVIDIDRALWQKWPGEPAV